jgi:hypothetical protein
MNFDKKNSEHANDVDQELIHDSINECRVKLSLIDDYLERFQIEDVRLLAPIKDVQRCVAIQWDVMAVEKFSFSFSTWN